MAHDPYEPTVGGLQVPPPYAFTGLKVFGFPMIADLGPLQSLCDHFLAIAPGSTGITFEPIPALGPFVPSGGAIVTMQAIDYGSLNATTAPWDDFGGAPQKEIYFAVPVVIKRGGVPSGIGVFLPYVFVDNFVSAVTAREVLGLPKILSTFTFANHFPAGSLSMKFTGRKTLRAPIKEAQCIKVTSPSGGVAPVVPLPTLGMFFGPLEMLYIGNPFFAPLIAAAHHSGVYFGFSARSIIDPANPSGDAIQSILQCRYTMSNVTSSGLLPPVLVSFTPFLGLDIPAALGIRLSDGKAIPVGSFVLECDLLLDNVTTVWTS